MFFLLGAGWLLLATLLHLFVWFSGYNRGFGTTLAVVGEAELAGVVTLPLTTVGLVGFVLNLA